VEWMASISLLVLDSTLHPITSRFIIWWYNRPKAKKTKTSHFLMHEHVPHDDWIAPGYDADSQAPRTEVLEVRLLILVPRRQLRLVGSRVDPAKVGVGIRLDNGAFLVPASRRFRSRPPLPPHGDGTDLQPKGGAYDQGRWE
jgi:hypothetical protein